MKRYLMTCGHVDNATCEGKPACAICDCTEVKAVLDSPTKGLEGRVCICNYCKKVRPSAWDLPFFEYRPDEKYDTAYDGCWGWN